MPIELVCAKTRSASASVSSGIARTHSVCAGRPFFIRIGTSQASIAPAASRASRAPGHRRGSRSSTLASSWTARSRSPAGEGADLAVTSSWVEPTGTPTSTRTTFGQPALSFVPAPTPTRSSVTGGTLSHPEARARTRATPVGVASSPTPLAAPGVAVERAARPGSPLTGQPLASCVTAGTGTGMSPCAARTRPDPSASGEALRLVTPSRRSASQVPTTSAIESSAPTSWKCTSSGEMPCTKPSASASRANVACARRRVTGARSASANMARIDVQVRWGGSVTTTSTSTFVARCPPRTT